MEMKNWNDATMRGYRCRERGGCLCYRNMAREKRRIERLSSSEGSYQDPLMVTNDEVYRKGLKLSLGV